MHDLRTVLQRAMSVGIFTSSWMIGVAAARLNKACRYIHLTCVTMVGSVFARAGEIQGFFGTNLLSHPFQIIQLMIMYFLVQAPPILRG